MDITFHISLPCLDIEETKIFYQTALLAKLGRNTNQWADINLYGNQITFTKSGAFHFAFKNYKFENVVLPSFHFGIVMPLKEWNYLYKKVQEHQQIMIDKTHFLQAKNGEHTSFFVKDPNGYIVEFKTFLKPETIFEK